MAYASLEFSAFPDKFAQCADGVPKMIPDIAAQPYGHAANDGAVPIIDPDRNRADAVIWRERS